MDRPLIGLSSYREPARWGVWDQRADLLPTTYAEAVLAAGGAPVLLPPGAPYAEVARAVVTRLDGLVITGGADVAPAAYDAEPHPATDPPRADRDAWELALLDAAAQRSLPTLGICRGMQVMAVHAGGVLDQHLPDVTGDTTHSPGGPEFGTTEVTFEPGSVVRAVVGVDHVEVRCHHHQAVQSHPGFRPVGWSHDGVLEAMEKAGERFCLAVQWHPEEADDTSLFVGFVAAARAGRPVSSQDPP